jgi:hypothetical protein
MKVQNLHVVFVKSLPQTDTKPWRFSLISERFERDSVTYNKSQFNSPITAECAIEVLTKLGYKVEAQGEAKNNNTWLMVNLFLPLKEAVKKPITISGNTVEIEVPSELYNITKATGTIEDALRRGWLPCADGSDYKLDSFDVERIKNLQASN